MDTNIRRRPYVATGGSQTSASLDTSVQLRQSATDPAASDRKKARNKSFSLPLATALCDLRSPLEKSYRSTIYCASSIGQADGRKFTKYCGQRWCLVCNRIRTARAIEAYAPIIDSWDDPQFVTLTVRNCSADELPATFDLLLEKFTSCKRSITRTHGLPLVALRKVECTFNGTDYHPHLHCIVDGTAQAELLRSLWLKRLPGQTDAKGQDVRPCDDRGQHELFKYFSKLTTKTASTGGRSVIGVEHLDIIFRAMKGRRVYQSVGFTLPPAVDETINGETIEVEGSAAYNRPDEDLVWDWEQSVHDWVDRSTGDCLSGHVPSAGWVKFTESIETPEGRPASAQQLSVDTAVSPAGNLVTTDHRPPTTITHEANDMLRAGMFPIEGSTFTVDGQDYLLRERDNPTKAKPKYYLLAMPGGHYVSGLWPKGPDVYSVDFTRSDGAERVYRLDFKTPGFVQIVDDGFSRRSLKSAPWHRSRRTGKGQ